MMRPRPTLAVTGALFEAMMTSVGKFLVVRPVSGPERTYLGHRIVTRRDAALHDDEMTVALGSGGIEIDAEARAFSMPDPLHADDPHCVQLEVVRVVDHGIRLLFSSNEDGSIPNVYDRQVRAFGADGQALLRRLRVGVVGAGGTGSAVCEQLIRLGVGTIVVIDDDTVNEDGSNVTRIWGSTMEDVGMAKVDIVARTGTTVGFGTEIVGIKGTINDEATARELRHCDVVFGCTDDNRGRVTLSRLAYRYLVPVIDMGVKIDSFDGLLRSIDGRVTVVAPGTACLDCRGRIDRTSLQSELLPAAERSELIEEGYAIGLGERDPAVIAYTTSVAAFAVAEMIQRLFGLDDEPPASEYLIQHHFREVRRNLRPGYDGHWCTDPDVIAAGDAIPFLGVMWTQ